MGITNLSRFQLGFDVATASSGAATLNHQSGIVTTESLSTAAGAVYTLTLTNNSVQSTSQVLVTVGYGTSTTGVPVVQKVTPASGSVVIKVLNTDAAAALNGTLIVSFLVLNPQQT